MRCLVTGAAGMLGRAVLDAARALGHEARGFTRAEWDIADPVPAGALVAGDLGEWDAVLNCAAFTAVDRAESDAGLAEAANALGPSFLAQACALSGLRLVHFSTDYVFDGRSTVPYTEESPTNPLGVYGRTKLDGEERVRASGARAYILRTSWLFGPTGRCFPRTIVERWRAGQPLQIVDDQIGNPTYAPHLARCALQLLAASAEPGTYHATGPETLSWHAFAVRVIEVARASGLAPVAEASVAAVPTGTFPTRATRPMYSVLSNAKLHAAGMWPMPALDTAIQEFVGHLDCKGDAPT